MAEKDEWRGLPSGYTQVTYIESSGTQYIDTGFKPNQDTRIVTDAVFPAGSATKRLYGARMRSMSNAFCFTASSSGYYLVEYGSAQKSFSSSANCSTKFTIDHNKNTVTLNGAHTVTCTAETFAAPCNLVLFGMNDNGSVTGYSATIYTCQIYDNGTIIRDFVPCVNADGKAGLYDMVNGLFYTNAGTGSFVSGDIVHKPKNMYISDDGLYRKVKKGFLTDDNSVYRKVKKAFLTVGGVYRPCWSGGGKLEYYGTVTPLSVARQHLAATTVGDHALFGGGEFFYPTVDAYDKSLTRTTPTALSAGRGYLAATTVVDYALFGGGSDNSSTYNVVDSYDKSLTKTTPTALSVARRRLAATTVGDYAMFGGGGSTNSSSGLNIVDAYDKSLTRTTPTALSAARYGLAATTVGGYALFGGGVYSSTFNVVDAYDKSLTRTTPTALSAARYGLAATIVGGYALFGGGMPSAVVDAYDKSLTRTTPTALSAGRGYLAATTVDGYALFGGGSYSSRFDVVDAYDKSLTRTTPTALSAARDGLAATTVGGYALFGGGSTNSDSDAVDAYTVA